MANSSHNHRRKLLRQCRRQAFGKKWTARLTLPEWKALRQKGYELFREKVAAIVKASKEATLMAGYGAGELRVRQAPESLEGLVPVAAADCCHGSCECHGH